MPITIIFRFLLQVLICNRSNFTSLKSVSSSPSESIPVTDRNHSNTQAYITENNQVFWDIVSECLSTTVNLITKMNIFHCEHSHCLFLMLYFNHLPKWITVSQAIKGGKMGQWLQIQSHRWNNWAAIHYEKPTCLQVNMRQCCFCLFISCSTYSLPVYLKCGQLYVGSFIYYI